MLLALYLGKDNDDENAFGHGGEEEANEGGENFVVGPFAGESAKEAEEGAQGQEEESEVEAE